MRTYSVLAVTSLLSLVVSSVASAIPIYGLIGGVNSTKLISYDSSNPSVLTSQVALTGFPANDLISEIDFRPSNGLLYGLGTNRLYTINPTTGAVSVVGGTTLSRMFNSFGGFDFDPVADVIHYVDSSSGNNFIINPDTAAITQLPSVAYAAGDPRFGSTPSISGAAFSNNVAGSSSSAMYVYDYKTGYGLATQNVATGALTSVGSYVTTSALTTPYEFDIAPDGEAFMTADAFFNAGDVGLYSVNLSTGAISGLGVIGGTPNYLDVRGLAIPAGPVPEPAAVALFAVPALTVLRRRR